MGDNPNPGGGPSPFSSPDLQSTLNQMGMGGAPGAKPGAAGGAGMPGGLPGAGSKPPKPPRPIGTPVQEAKYLGKDIGQGVADFLPPILKSVLGIKSGDTQEEIARKKKMLQNYNGLEADQQKIVAQKMEERKRADQQAEAEKAQEAKKAEANRSGDLPIPVGKSRGEGGAGASQKTNTLAKLKSDRTKPTSAG